MEIIRCNLCGTSAFQLLHSLPDWHFGLEDRLFDFVKCSHCGLVYQNPRLTVEEIGAYYPQDYECYRVVDSQKQPSWLMKRVIQFGFTKRWNAILKYKSYGRLLDVGCATGNFLDHMKGNSQWSLQGIEISPEAAGLARSRGLDVTVGSLDQIHFEKETFDAITLWDVLEHLHDPSKALAEIFTILKQDGILVFRVPNLDSWDYRLFKQYWSGFETPRHLYIFTQSTLKSLLEKSGFKIVQTGSEFGSFMTIILDIRFWLTAKGYSKAAVNRIAKVLYHPVLRMMLSPIAAVLSGILPGPSLTVVAMKAPTADA